MIKQNNLHTSRYTLLYMRVNIAIPQKNDLKRNVQYQLKELMSKFDEDLLEEAKTFNMNSFVQNEDIFQSI